VCTWVSSYICVQKPSDCFLQYQAGLGAGGGGRVGLFCFHISSTVLLLFLLYLHYVSFPCTLFCYTLSLLFSSFSSTSIFCFNSFLYRSAPISFYALFLLRLLLYLSALLLLYCSAHPTLKVFCSPCSSTVLLSLLSLLTSVLLLSLLYCSVFPPPFLICSHSTSAVLLPVLPVFLLSLLFYYSANPSLV
jgi:hypothetical protein